MNTGCICLGVMATSGQKPFVSTDPPYQSFLKFFRYGGLRSALHDEIVMLAAKMPSN